MIPLIPMLTDTDICIDPGQVINLVHEWGVVVFERSGEVHSGLPLAEPVYTDTPDVAYAPVVWIHGVPFSGTLTVNAEDLITYTWPAPDRTADGSAEWDITGSCFTTQEQTCVPAGMPFIWGVDFYKNVQSLVLTGKSGWCSNFIYYDCTVDRQLSEVFFETLDTDAALFTPLVTEGLYFQGDDQYLIDISGDRLIPLNMTVNTELAAETFCRWAGPGMKSSEIDALWETWSPILTGADQGWLVFPIPEEYHNMISSLTLETGGGTVEYERFYLGAVRVNRL